MRDVRGAPAEPQLRPARCDHRRLRRARRALVVVMDCDLQDPPEDIPRLLRDGRMAGKDIVLARRVGRRHSWFRRTQRRAYFRLMRTFINSELDGDYGIFSIVSRPVVDAYLAIGDRGRHYLFILNWLGFETRRDRRRARRSARRARARTRSDGFCGTHSRASSSRRPSSCAGSSTSASPSASGRGLLPRTSAYFALAKPPYPAGRAWPC